MSIHHAFINQKYRTLNIIRNRTIAHLQVLYKDNPQQYNDGTRTNDTQCILCILRTFSLVTNMFEMQYDRKFQLGYAPVE